MKDSNNTCLTGFANPDRESWARAGDTAELRLWLRLLTCSTLVENRLRSLMRTRFDTTLPRFDLMAQLANAPAGMKMSDLSRCMMVTNGNITGITDQLERDGLVERLKVDTDRRSCLIRLTAKGRQSFRRMSAAYQGWLGELFKDIPEHRRELLYELLGELKLAGQAAARLEADSPPN
ncbi:MarR family transcriptional regulator [Yanghanlia caeni]|uniref:MarR family transcriptional regulator n=1 Tax=Yanghanlia caeni TaxID=3064283 RepID=A0ABU1D401_9BURK|nr:MarR family transcriptional regulator [Alcaligenaceae bacterium LG-2]NGR08325.1 MarR family transcriptional regulator [bacterium SGD-2]HZH57418.1 MarR family transcriptional regulator [Burkholderiaceae bacterium]